MWGPISIDTNRAESFGSNGLATYAGFTYTANQFSQVTIPLGINAGPCVRLTVSGSGYCWVSNIGVIVLNSGVQGATLITTNSCNASQTPNGNDVIKLSVVGTTITCQDITSGQPAGTVTDSTYSTGKAGMFTGSFRPADDFVSGNL